MKRKLLIPTLIIAGVVILIIVYSIFSRDDTARLLEVPVEYGTFEVAVSVTGELQAKNSTEIRAPMELRNREFRFRSIKIQDLIPEEGEINLEQSQFEPPATIRQAKINLDKAQRAYLQAQQNYVLKVQQAKADMTELTMELAKQTRRR